MQKIKNNPYLLINLIFAGIIVLLLLYSGIFSATGLTHPVKSVQQQAVVSTGLSRAFSEIVRLNFTKAAEYNSYAIKLFLFFFIQLFMRITAIYLLLSSHISKNLLIYSDVFLSVLLFLWAFSKFIIQQF